MSQSSPRLSLPFIQSAQAQKHVTHNEAIRALDLLVQLSFIDDALNTPPVAPQIGDCYIVASGGNGTWLGHDGEIAAYLDGAWQFQTAKQGPMTLALCCRTISRHAPSWGFSAMISCAFL